MDLEKLIESLKALDARLDALLAGDSLSAEQETEYKALDAERKALVNKIGLAQAALTRKEESARLAAEIEQQAAVAAQNARRAQRTESAGRLTGTDVPARSTPTGAPAGAVVGRVDAQNRVLSYFEDAGESATLQFGDSHGQRRQSFRQLQRRYNTELKAHGYVPWGEFKSEADFIRAGLTGHGQERFRERHRQHFLTAPLGMSEGVGSDGGYTVMPEFSTNILDRVYKNDLWGRTDNYPITGNNMTFLATAETSRLDGSRAGGLRGFWLGEGASLTPSKPTLREVTLKLLKLGVVVYLTDELLSDTGVALSEWVARKAAEEFNFLIGNALVNGTGVGQPLGMLNFPSLVSVSAESGQATRTLVSANLVKMFQRFYAPNLDGAVFYHNQDILAQLFLLTLGIGTAGIATYMPPGGLSGAPYSTILGRPTRATEFNPTLGTSGDILLADMGQILSISKGGVMQAVSLEIQFLTDQVAVRFIMRLNATPWENAPITPYKGSNTQANFIVLNSR